MDARSACGIAAALPSDAPTADCTAWARTAQVGDTTLRDGEQAPGVCLGIRTKAQVAGLLDQAGIARIDVCVPAAGIREREVLRQVRSACRRARLSAWSRATPSDVAATLACEPDEIHVTAPVSVRQITRKLQTTPRKMLEGLLACVRLAAKAGFCVSVGLEDASRADPAFVAHVVRAVADAGATSVQAADTVGVLTPWATERLISGLVCASDAAVSFHGHNDLGMALPCALAALQSGAFLVEGTLGGIGERAGNCDIGELCRLLNDLGADFDLDALAAAQDLVDAAAGRTWRAGLAD